MNEQPSDDNLGPDPADPAVPSPLWWEQAGGRPDPGLLSYRDQEAAFVALQQRRRADDAFELALLAEWDRTGRTDALEGLKTASFVAARAVVPRAEAFSRVRTAVRLRDHLRVTGAALAEGRIGIDHAKAMAKAVNDRIVDAFVVFEPALVDVACSATFERFKAELDGVVAALDQDGGHKDPADRACLAMGWVNDTLVLSGQVAGLDAHSIETAIDKRADALFRRYQNDAAVCGDLKVPCRTSLRMLALAEICRESLSASPDDNEGPTAEVSLIVKEGEPVRTTDGRLVHPDVAAVWLCDPRVHAIVADSLGQLVDYGRQCRWANRTQRRIVLARDGGCVFPGCTSTCSWADIHHVKHWTHRHGTDCDPDCDDPGGNTDIANMVALCRHHHGVAHRKGWALAIDHTMHTTWTSPTGHTFPGQQHGKTPTATGPP